MSEILIYQTDDGQTRLEVQLGEDTVWLSLNQIADLFQRDKSVVSRHIKNVFEERELEAASVVANFATTATDGKTYQVEHFNLDVIISVGYRVKSQRGTQFRRWATQRLREFLVKGFVLNDQRFKENGTDRHFEELLQRIRDIRSSEKVFWRKVLDIYATSEDYDANAETSKLFFATVQNKMHWAAHGHTAAEVIEARADHTKPLAGLTNFPGSRPLAKDAKVAKNYLDPEELNALNLIVSLYLDFAELQALNRRSMTMAAWINKLDDFLRIADREILSHAGTVSRDQADAKAELEFTKWRELESNRESQVERDFTQAVERAKRLEKKQKP
ncbi:COG3943 Virulence protein [Fimbriimonadaceae bacterium]